MKEIFTTHMFSAVKNASATKNILSLFEMIISWWCFVDVFVYKNELRD